MLSTFGNKYLQNGSKDVPWDTPTKGSAWHGVVVECIACWGGCSVHSVPKPNTFNNNPAHVAKYKVGDFAVC